MLQDSLLTVKQGVLALPTLPFITSSVTALPLEEGGDHTDSVTGPSLRTMGPSAKFVVLSDSSHHSGAKSADPEVDSFARSVASGCQVFLAQISAKKEEDKSEGKQIKDVPIVRDFPEVFPEDLPGLPSARPVEFQIDLIPGAAPVARAPYRLAPSEIKELSEQLQELSDKGFIRPSSSP
ncbi:hypothetical protein Tco_0593949 [Tanacetum coccineum]